VLDRIAGKWTTLVLLALEQEGTLRFSELRSRFDGVSQKMLTQTPRGLEADGIVTRTVYSTVPVTVEYSLTDLGSSLSDAVATLRGWAYDHMPQIERARQDHQRRRTPPPQPQPAADAPGNRL
jgi:DNA-binding HxlR family transcriptional regulator